MKLLSADLFFRPPLKLRPKTKEISNGDYFSIMKRLAQEKAVKVDQVIVHPRTNKWLKGVALVFCVGLLVLVAVHVLKVVIP